MYPIDVILYSWPVANKNQAVERERERKGRARKGMGTREKERVGSGLMK